ncbi:MAG: cupin domain-containing protein [Micromonosporaceae bacterium]
MADSQVYSASQQDRHLSDLVERAAHPGVNVLKKSHLEASLHHHDPFLYTAHRDVHSRRLPDPKRESITWRADEVHYSSGALPSGECMRSIGHWNPPDQVEIFQVTHGRVVVLVALPERTDYLSVAEYGPGDVCVIPLGAYHITFSPWQPSVVFNIYNQYDSASGPSETSKYEGKPPPARTLITEGGEPRLTPGIPEPDSTPLTYPFPAPEVSVTRMLLESTDEQLLWLRDQIEVADRSGWPLA